MKKASTERSGSFNEAGSGEAGSGEGVRTFGGMPVLGLIAVLSLLIYGGITALSARFDLSVPGQERPILLTLTLFWVAFVLYLASIGIASRVRQTRKLCWVIFGFAIAFRGVLLFSSPIQEVDINRYIWDGVVCTQGISPFRYSPDQVLEANAMTCPDLDLRQLARLRDQDDTLKDLLQQLHSHFGFLPTVYPPTSQAVFAAAAWTTPAHASRATRIRVMKAWLVLFDVGVILLVMKLLIGCGKPPGLSVAYAWCPLVLKEVSNSGHLDSIAVFFTTLALFGLVRELGLTRSADRMKGWDRGAAFRLGLTALGFALAVGAKLYPVVLVPLVALVALRQFGWKKTAIAGVVFSLAVACLLMPMLPGSNPRPSNAVVPQPAEIAEAPVSRQVDPSLGITTFLKRWEMNDLLYMIVVENLKPVPHESAAGTPSESPQIWFSILSEARRDQIVARASRWLGTSIEETPFLLTRILTTLVFLIVALSISWKVSSEASPTHWMQAAFLILAWFWLLSPTQNPWYWMWAIPCLPWMHNRAWYLLSGLVFVYYLRFWFGYHYGGVAVANTPYQGTAFFDFVVTWFEFGPWMIWLAVEGIVRTGFGRTIFVRTRFIRSRGKQQEP